MTNKRLPVSLGLILLLITSVASADDWLQWRNNDFTSVSSEKNLPDALNVKENLRWRVELPGSAGSSPIVVNDQIFCTSVDGDDLLLMCVVDGKIQWKQKLAGRNQASRDGANSASPSPCSDGEHIWTMMGNGALACFTLEGKSVWEIDLQEKYGKFNIQFGMSSTPLLYEGCLYLQLMHGNMRNNDPSEGKVICLDAVTGKEKWMQLRKTDGVRENKHSYASPTMYLGESQQLLITHGADYVIAHALDDGHEVWRRGGLNPKGPNYNPFLRFVASPVCTKQMVIAPTAKRGPVVAIDPSKTGDLTDQADSLHWKLKRGTPDVATPVVYQDIVYLAGERGELSCLDVKTGKVLYKERTHADKHRSTPVAGDGKIYLADRKGTLWVFQAGATPKVLSKHSLGEEITASPAVSNGKIYIRSFDALYCFGDN